MESSQQGSTLKLKLICGIQFESQRNFDSYIYNIHNKNFGKNKEFAHTNKVINEKKNILALCPVSYFRKKCTVSKRQLSKSKKKVDLNHLKQIFLLCMGRCKKKSYLTLIHIYTRHRPVGIVGLTLIYFGA